LAGLPEFNVPSLDPVFYERHHAIYDNSDVHADIDVNDVYMYGMRNVRILSVKTHLIDDVFRLEIELEFPDLQVDGKVKINGSMGPFRLNNAGKKEIYANDLSTNALQDAFSDVKRLIAPD